MAGPASPWRALLPLCAAMACGFLAVSMPLPVLALHVHRDLGFTSGVAGLAVGLQSIATVATRLPAGRFVDRAGPAAALRIGLLLAAASGAALLLAALVPAPPAGALGALFASRVLLGVGESLFITGVLTWAIGRAGPGRAGLAMGWNGMAQYGALAAGGPLGFAVEGAFGLAGVAALGIAFPCLALAIVLPLAAPEPAPAGARPRRLLEVIRPVAAPGFALMLAGIGYAAIAALAPLLFAAEGWPGAERALLAYGGAFVAVRVVLAGLPDRKGGRLVAAASMTVAALGQALLWRATGPGMALLGAGLTGAGCSLVFPSLGLIAVSHVPAEGRGSALGLFAMFQDLALGLTGPCLGALGDAAGFPAVFLAGALAAAAGCVLSLRLPGPPSAGPRPARA